MNAKTFAKRYTNGVAWDEEDMNLVSRLAQAFLDCEDARTSKPFKEDAYWTAVAHYQTIGAELARKNPAIYECWRTFYAESRGY